MREILFRGKRIDNGEWVEGYFGIKGLDEFKQYCIMIPTFHGTSGLPVMQSDFYFTDITIDPATVGQYTGLTDKNGKKIFEGDIVQTHIGDVYEFTFIDPYSRFALRRQDVVFGWSNPKLCEVIGNIHNNPELLEVKK